MLNIWKVILGLSKKKQPGLMSDGSYYFAVPDEVKMERQEVGERAQRIVERDFDGLDHTAVRSVQWIGTASLLAVDEVKFYEDLVSEEEIEEVEDGSTD